jgi:hypothetical protein
MPTRLQELEAQWGAKAAQLETILEQAKKSNGEYDFTKAEAFAHMAGREDAQAVCREMFTTLNKECDALYNQAKTQRDVEEQEARIKQMMADRKRVVESHVHAGGSEPGQPVMIKSLGTLVREDVGDGGFFTKGGNYVRTFQHFDVKTLMTTSAGWAPEAMRIPRIAEFAHRPIQVTDLFPMNPTTQYAVPYMEETTSTNTAQETTEGSSALEATIAGTARSVTVQNIPVYMRVTEQQLDDVEIISGLIDTRLRFFVQQRFDSQLINGNGVAPNILGLLAASIGSQARGTDPIPDCLYKGATQVRVTGRAVPSAHVVHPDNWSNVRLMRTTDGVYIWGSPSEAGPMRMFGVPVVEADVMPLNTSVVGDFTNMAAVWIRRGVEVEVGWINDDFVKGIRAIKASLRACLTVYRPAAFVACTDLDL